MKTIEITRRRFWLAAPFAWLLGMVPRFGKSQEPARVDRQLAEPHHKRYFNQPLDEWLREVRETLPYLASAFAQFERRGVMDEDPSAWYRMNYVGVIPWRPGVVMVYAFGRCSEAQASFTEAAAWLDEARVTTIAAGWSDDRRAWTRFVLSDHATLAPLVKTTTAPLSCQLAAERLTSKGATS